MRLFFTFLAISLAVLLPGSHPVEASDILESVEAVTSFESTIVVNRDNSIDVTETIVYNTGESEHHGILRNILERSSQGRKMRFTDISVVDEQGTEYQFKETSDGETTQLKIGSPDVTFNGEKTYVIHYHATNAVGQSPETDEIYWNVTGNEWSFPIRHATSTVLLPAGVSATQFTCYRGLKWSTHGCDSATGGNGTYVFTSGELLTGEGLTVAVGFPKGVVPAYPPPNKYLVFLATYWAWIGGVGSILVSFYFSFSYWYRKGRDPKGTGIIIPQYDAPDDLTPMEVVAIVEEKVLTRHISAEIIYLATKGYLKIKETERKLLGLTLSIDYELTRTLKDDRVLNAFDTEILGLLFKEYELQKKTLSIESIKMSNLTLTKVHTDSLIEEVAGSVKEKGYYKNIGKLNGKIAVFFTVLAFSTVPFFLFATVAVAGLGLKAFGQVAPFTIGVMTAFIIVWVFYYFSPAKTPKGVQTKEYLLGLKEYLMIAEKDRLLFHNAPEKKPEVFEKLLPYAMALGVADIWAKEFEDIYKTPPSWYSGGDVSHFGAVGFMSSLSSFSSAVSATTPSSSSSGSGGGGFSGGGGGGGGGGSW